jgi:hypothetical protein
LVFMNSINRRRFLASSGKATATMAAGSALLAFPRIARSQSEGNHIVLALIGAGGRAANHASGMSKLPGVEFKYVCDVWKDRGAGIMKELEGVQKRAPQRISDMRVAFDDKEVGAVVIATPEHWHALATVWGCQAGKDVYVEKNPTARPNASPTARMPTNSLSRRIENTIESRTRSDSL